MMARQISFGPYQLHLGQVFYESSLTLGMHEWMHGIMADFHNSLSV
jgi:hypothetical protein